MAATGAWQNGGVARTMLLNLRVICLARALLIVSLMRWGVPFLIILAGCGPNAFQVARARAASDLSCPAEQVWVYESAGGTTIAGGCGNWLEYQCFYPERRFSRLVCLREVPLQSSAKPPSPRERAEREVDPYHPPGYPPGW